MEWISQLQEAIRFMETHLLEKINYETVAASAHMSSYHFHRCFSMLAGMTANDYIRQRRLSLAAQELQNTDSTVLDAAFKYGWETPESFTKAFVRFHGITPRQAKQKGATLRMFNALAIKLILEGGTVMAYRMVKQEGQTFMALVRSFSNGNFKDENGRSVPEFWDECINQNRLIVAEHSRPEGKRDLYGLCCPVAEGQDRFEYGIGVLVDGDMDAEAVNACLNEGFCFWKTEPMEYVVFDCIGTDSHCIQEMWQTFYREFLPQSGYEHANAMDYEIYAENPKPDVFCELWIPVQKK